MFFIFNYTTIYDVTVRNSVIQQQNYSRDKRLTVCKLQNYIEIAFELVFND